MAANEYLDVSDFSQSQKLYGVYEWSISGECPETFDNSYIIDLINCFDEWGSLTDRQESALENIIRAFEVDLNWLIEIDDDYEPDL